MAKIKPLPDLKGYGRVRVYRNLRNGKLSVMCTHSRKVIGHTEHICLTRAKFIVSKKGIERIRRDRRKIVCAFVEGFPAKLEAGECQSAVLFDPYMWSSFVNNRGDSLYSAEKIVIYSSGWMWADGLQTKTYFPPSYHG